MEFLCIKSVIYNWTKQYFKFIEGQTYKANYISRTETSLELINEQGNNHKVGEHWVNYRLDKFYNEHFINVKSNVKLLDIEVADCKKKGHEIHSIFLLSIILIVNSSIVCFINDISFLF